MPDGNYIFNQETLTYEKKEPKKGRKLLIAILSQAIAAIVIGVVVFLAISYTIKTPRQKKLERENEAMQQELNVLSERYTKVDSVLNDIQQRDRDLYRAIFETEMSGWDGSNGQLEKFESIADDKMLADTVRGITERQQQMLTREEGAFNELKYKLTNYKENLTEIPSILPISDPNVELGYYGFGKKLDPIYKTPETHEGLDIAASTGTEVMATANGIVEYVGDKQRYGQHIVINHKNGYKTIYAHLSGYVARYGQRVRRGEVIGFVGNSGKSLTPHLHYEIQYKSQAVNPTTHTFGSLRPAQWQKLNETSKSIGLSLD